MQRVSRTSPNIIVKTVNNSPKVIDLVVNNDLCIGCGLCVYACPSKALKMKKNEFGFLIPELIADCDQNGDCISVCPFNVFPEKNVETENELAKHYLKECDKSDAQIGRYQNIYAGYSSEYRLTSSSGGIATFVLAKLLENGIVSHVISVKGGGEEDEHYKYAINSNKEELLESSKTRYFPVTLAEAFSNINNLEGNVAIVGVACFIKAVRLAQYRDPVLKNKINFLVGIICGGVKSSFFTEYLADKTGVSKKYINKPNYRIKDFDSSAGDYSFDCEHSDSKEKRSIRMREVGDMWGTGLFKANACDFCDDVTTELADISIGDAWLEPFVTDGRGDNVVLTRSNLAEKIIQDGISKREVNLEHISLDRFLSSQKGSFNHRHLGLPFRVQYATKKGLLVPPKRIEKDESSIFFKIVQYFRLRTRVRSLEVWKKYPNAKFFDRKIKMDLYILKIFTRLNHKIIALNKRLKMKRLQSKGK
jgi:coenzyme F420 hydrogenase subunit beta